MSEIYLGGAMTEYYNKGEYDKALGWRLRIKYALAQLDTDVFDPTDYVNWEKDDSFKYDLYRLKNTTVLLVMLQSPEVISVGTDMELAIAHEYEIPIVIINKTGNDLHPWIKACCMYECDNEEEAISYIREHFIYT